MHVDRSASALSGVGCQRTTPPYPAAEADPVDRIGAR
jgi:hypothetical protein